MHKLIKMKSITLEDYAKAVFFNPELLHDEAIAPSIFDSVKEINQRLCIYNNDLMQPHEEPEHSEAIQECISYLENLRKQLIA